MSRVTFKDANRVEANLHFGCGVFTTKDEEIDVGNEHINFIFNLLKTLGPSNNKKWTPYRSFFMSADFEIQFDFSEASKTFNPFGSGGVKMVKDLPGVFASITNFEVEINELNVFKGQNKIQDDADFMNMQIASMKRWTDDVPYLFKPL